MICRPKVENKIDDAELEKSNLLVADSSTMKYVSLTLVTISPWVCSY